MQTSRAISLAAAAALVLVLASEARAEDGVVIVGGGASHRERAVIARAVEGAARRAAWSLGEPLGERDASVIVSCLAADRPWSCIAPIATPRGLQRIAVVHAEPERTEGGDQLVLTGELVVAGNGVPAIDRRYCARCGQGELTAASVELMQRLLEDSAARVGHALLDVRTSPSGVTVTLDGRRVGEGNGLFATRPGKHELRLHRSGYRPAVRAVTARGGGVEIVSVVMERESGGEGDSDGETIVPLMVVGGGAIGVVGGTYASLTARSRAVGLQAKYNYSAAGIGIAITGVAAIGAGLYLWLHPSKKRSTPMLSALPSGWVAGWSTSL